MTNSDTHKLYLIQLNNINIINNGLISIANNNINEFSWHMYTDLYENKYNHLYKNILSNIKVSNNLVFNSEICNYNINIIDIYKELEYIIEF